MGDQIIQTAGLLVKHILGVFLLAWQRMARSALISFVTGFLLVEIVGAVYLGHFPATTLTHVVALIFALAAAYAVSLTVFIDELVIGAVDLIKLLEGDAHAGARAMAAAAERHAGESGNGLMRWLGHRPAAAPEVSEQRRQTQADIDATEVFVSTAPRLRVNARPVEASQLPRITWAMEQLEHPEQDQPVKPRVTQPVDLPTKFPSTPTPPLEPAVTATLAAIQEPVAAARVTPTARVTRPITQPLAEDSASGAVEGQRSIWSRISKTLVGSVHPPLEDGGDIEP